MFEFIKKFFAKPEPLPEPEPEPAPEYTADVLRAALRQLDSDFVLGKITKAEHDRLLESILEKRIKAIEEEVHARREDGDHIDA